MRELKKTLIGMCIVLASACQLPTVPMIEEGASEPQPPPPPDMRPWTEHEVPGAMGESGWTDIASSADGSKLAAIVSGGYVYTSEDGGVTWTEQTSSGRRSWTGITISADGTKLAACVSLRFFLSAVPGYIYTSADGGATWTEQTSAGCRFWQDITCSADGTTLAAAVWTTASTYPVVWPPGYIYTSSDSGVTWTERRSAGSRKWDSITCSADGTRLAALADEDVDRVGNYLECGCVLTSTDSGATWTEQVSGWWEGNGLAGSADGKKLALSTNGGISVSMDSGATWIKRINRESSSSTSWYALTISADGSTLAAAGQNSCIYTSTDDGVSWTEQTASGQRNWICITSSSDGIRLAACASRQPLLYGSGYIYTSVDGGLSWAEQTSAGYRFWNDITSSADGTKLAAVVLGGYIYTSSDGGITWTEQTSAGRKGWTCITSSADGTKLAAGVCEFSPDRPSYIYTSSDSGATWTACTSAGSRHWQSISSSADGTKLAAASNYVYTSTDGGVNWMERTASGSNLKTDITSSADGTRLAAIGCWDDNTCIHASADGGATWTKHIFKDSWSTGGDITCSADGTKLAALVSFPSPNIETSYPDINFSCVFTSADGGVTWTSRTGLMSSDWECITSSADGTKLAAGVLNECVYTSSDSGATWASCPCSGSRHWRSITSSADGTKLAAVPNPGNYIFTSP